MKIGLTGSIACGKSTASLYLRSLGYAVVDADAISHALTAAGGAALPALYSAFGSAAFHEDGTLNRRALGCLVFGNENLRARLNAILHPMIIDQLIRELDALDGPGQIVFGDVPLLFECGMERCFDRIWVVTASRETQISRLHQRDGLSREDACARIDAQMPQEEKLRRADASLSTESSIEDTQAQIDLLLADLTDRRHI